jgi:hypothetical protein
VDSDIFYDHHQKPVEVWNEMISDLDEELKTTTDKTESYSVYMNNYVQLYVNDLNAIMSAIKTSTNDEDIDYFTRISSTPGSQTLNVGHVMLYAPLGGTDIDVTGPLASVSQTYLNEGEFSEEWSTWECAGAHQLKWELSDYAALVEMSSLSSKESSEVAPLFISIGVPVTSLSKVDDIFTMVGTITNMTETVKTYS